MSSLAEKLLAIHASLEAGLIPHAFGGAIALAYCVAEPRGTRDIDVNLFVGIERANEALGALPRNISITGQQRKAIERDGQARLFWDDTPIDVFFNTDSFHDEVARDTRIVPFDSGMIPVLGCQALIVFKALFNRTKDWGDIETILESGIRPDVALRILDRLMGTDDAVTQRLRGLVRP